MHELRINLRMQLAGLSVLKGTVSAVPQQERTSTALAGEKCHYAPILHVQRIFIYREPLAKADSTLMQSPARWYLETTESS